MKITLISYYSSFNKYPTKYALGVLKLASYLKKQGHDVKIIPINSELAIDSIIIKNIAVDNPRIVGLPAYMWTLKHSQIISKEIKLKLPNTLRVVGGPSTNDIDFNDWQGDEIFINGEAELALREIVSALNEGDVVNIENLASNNIFNVHNSMITHVKYVDEKIYSGIPLFSNDYFQLLPGEAKNEMFSWYETSRGCLYSCGFCGHKTRNNLGFVDMCLIEEEIINISKTNIRRLFIIDPELGGIPDRGKQILRLFIKNAPDIKIIAYLRPEMLDDEYISLLEESNIEEIRIGIQTLNSNVPTWVRSNNTKKVNNILARLKYSAIPWRAELIVGLPGDNMEGLQSTIRTVIDSFQPSILSCYHLTAIKGTKLYDLVNSSSEVWLKVDDDYKATSSYSYDEREMGEMLDFTTRITNVYNNKKIKSHEKYVSSYLLENMF